MTIKKVPKVKSVSKVKTYMFFLILWKIRSVLKFKINVFLCSPKGVQQWSSLSSKVPSSEASGPDGITSRFVRVMLSRICEQDRKPLRYMFVKFLTKHTSAGVAMVLIEFVLWLVQKIRVNSHSQWLNETFPFDLIGWCDFVGGVSYATRSKIALNST